MTIGVLAMHHGTPATKDEIGPFYTRIRRGRAPSTSEIEALTARYDSIGGLSPLTERSFAQASALQGALDDLDLGVHKVFIGTKHASPSIEEAVAAMADEGIDRFVGLVYAPHDSSAIEEYLERAANAASAYSMKAGFLRDWHDLSEFVAALARRLTASLSTLDHFAPQ